MKHDAHGHDSVVAASPVRSTGRVAGRLRFAPLVLVAGLGAAAGAVRAASEGIDAALWCPAADADRRIEELRSLIQRAPTDTDARVKLAWLLYRYKNATDQAAELCAQVLQQRPEDYRATELAGLITFLRGDAAGAFEYWFRLLDHDQPETERYLLALPRIVEGADRRRRLDARLERLADDHAASPWLAAHAAWLTGNRLVDLRRFDEAHRRFRSLRPIEDWTVIGPFDNESNSGFSKSYGPEEEIDYAKSYAGRDRFVGWRVLGPTNLDGSADLADLMYPNDHVLAYAVTFVHLPADTDALARFGMESCGRLWVNGSLAWSRDRPTEFAFDQHTVPIVLRAGWNRILLKVCQHERGWRFLFRLTDAGGRSIEDLRVSREAQSVPHLRDAPPPEFDFARPMLEHYQRCLDRDPNDEAARYYLSSAAGANKLYAERARFLEALVGQNPFCTEYRMQLARAYFDDDKPEKALEQTKESIRLGPANLQARAMLGEFYAGRGLNDRAREVLDGVLAERPDWAVARRILQRVYESEGWMEPAYRQAKRIHELVPDSPWAAANFAGYCQLRGYLQEARELYEGVLCEEFTNGAARAALVTMDVGQDRHEDALALLADMQRVEPAANDHRLNRIAILLTRRQYEAAIALCQEALAVNAADFRVHRQLGDIHQRLGQDENALALFREGLTFNPDDQWLRKYVDFLAPVQNPAFARFGVSPEEAAEIARQRVDPAAFPRAGAVVLLDHLVTQLFEDGSSTDLEHQIIQILHEQGRRAYTRIGLRGDRADIKRAVVITPEGREVEATKVSPDEIHFDQLQPGSLIEYRVVYFNRPNEWMGRHYSGAFLFQNNEPMLRSQWVLLVPPNRKLNYFIQGELVNLAESEFGGQKVYDFTARDVPPLEAEPHRPPPADLVQSVRVSTIESWEDIARWEYTLIKDQFVPDANLKAKAEALTANCATRAEKIRALAGFVAEDIQYKILHGGIFGIKPHKAANVLQNEWGDCKDKATLLITMLAETGIKACYATLLTRDSGRLLRDLPFNQCNHAIVYVPDPECFEKGVWIDGTAQYYAPDTLPWPDQGVQALVFDDGGRMVFLETPGQAPAENETDFDLEATLSADGSADVKAHWRSTGQLAPPLRSHFRPVGKREEYLASLANQLLPGSRLGSYRFGDLEDRSRPVEIDLEFHAPRLAKLEGSQMVIRPVRQFEMTARFAARPIRYYDLFLQFRSLARLKETYILPEGIEVIGLPDPALLETPWMSYELRCTQSGRKVTLVRSLTSRELSIPKDRYGEFQTFCHDVDQIERRTINLRRPEAPPGGDQGNGK